MTKPASVKSPTTTTTELGEHLNTVTKVGGTAITKATRFYQNNKTTIDALGTKGLELTKSMGEKAFNTLKDPSTIEHVKGFAGKLMDLGTNVVGHIQRGVTALNNNKVASTPAVATAGGGGGVLVKGNDDDAGAGGAPTKRNDDGAGDVASANNDAAPIAKNNNEIEAPRVGAKHSTSNNNKNEAAAAATNNNNKI